MHNFLQKGWDGITRSTCTLPPAACPHYQSPGPVTAVVELPAGSTLGIQIGDHVTRLPRPPTPPTGAAREVMP